MPPQQELLLLHITAKFKPLLPLTLTSALDGGECSALRSGHFTPAEGAQYSLDMKLCGPQSQSVSGGWESPVIIEALQNLFRQVGVFPRLGISPLDGFYRQR